MRGKAQPHREADKNIAQHTAEKGFAEREPDLRLGDTDCTLADSTIAERMRM